MPTLQCPNLSYSETQLIYDPQSEFSEIGNDPNIITLQLNGHENNFGKFSFLNKDGQLNKKIVIPHDGQVCVADFIRKNKEVDEQLLKDLEGLGYYIHTKDTLDETSVRITAKRELEPDVFHLDTARTRSLLIHGFTTTSSTLLNTKEYLLGSQGGEIKGKIISIDAFSPEFIVTNIDIETLQKTDNVSKLKFNHPRYKKMLVFVLALKSQPFRKLLYFAGNPNSIYDPAQEFQDLPYSWPPYTAGFFEYINTNSLRLAP